MLKQGLQQRMQQRLSPQQIQLIKLLQVPTDALEQRIKEEMESNPALEEGENDGIEEEADSDEEQQEEEVSAEDETEVDEPKEEEKSEQDVKEEKEEKDDKDEIESVDEYESSADDLAEYMDDDEIPDYKLRDDNYPEENDRRVLPVPISTSFHEYLEEQLGLEELDGHRHNLGLYLIGSMDDDGYLRRPLDAMVDDLSFSQNIKTDISEIEEVLEIIQSFDPPGTGARDLKECMQLQLERDREHPLIKKLCIRVVEKYFEEFVKKHYEKMQTSLQVDDELFKQIISRLTHLNPKPGSAYTGSRDFDKIIIPDFYIFNNESKLELSLNQMNLPELRVSNQFRDMLRDYSKSQKKDNKQKEAVMFIRQKIDSAKWFIEAMKQRQQTLLLTMNAIMEHQYEFFLTGDEMKMKPMILKDIAEKTHLDISTVSRVANSKYVQTEFGTFRLKYFFSESLSTDSGEEVSTREVKKILTDFIELEDKKKPLSDEKLTDLLKEKGYNIARRTVAKYREQLNIPVARLRKEI